MKYVLGLFLNLGFVTGCASLSQKVDDWQNSQSQSASQRRTFQIRKVWVRQTDEGENLGPRKISRMKTVIHKDKVIQANGLDGVSAYSVETGRLIWKRFIQNGSEPSLAVINDRLFIGGGDGQFYSLDANNGQVVWSFPTRAENLSEPLIEHGVVYFLSGNNSFYAVDAATGKQLWLYSRQDPTPLSIRGGSKPAFRQGTLYVGFSDGALLALNADTGAIKWEKQLSKNKKFQDLDSDPVIEKDFMYVEGYDDFIYCLRVATGEVVWKTEGGGYGKPLLSGDRLYVANTRGELVALDKETGRQIWNYKIKSGGIASSPSIYKGLITFGESQGYVRFLDAATGKLVGSFEPGRGVMSPILTDESHGRVYFISNEANLYALEVGWKAPQLVP